jgi:C4-dicarboxylate transporter DctM subunit
LSIAVYIIGALILLVPMGVLIAVSLGFVGVLLLYAKGGFPTLISGLGYTFWNTGTGFTLSAIPLFVFMGEVLTQSGIGSLFFRAIGTILSGFVRGILPHTVIVGSSIFSALNGLSITNVAAFGTLVVPEIDRTGTDKKLVYGSLVGAGTLGILIPPSVTALIYCGMTGISVADVFIAGIVPGLIMSTVFIVYVALRIRLKPHMAGKVSQQKVSLNQRLKAMANLLPALFLIFITMGSIYFGWATPTEAGAVGAAAAMVFSTVYKKSVDLAMIWACSVSAAKITTMIMFIIACAQVMSMGLSSWGITGQLVQFLTALEVPRLSMVAIFGLMYLLLGCFVDGTSMMVLSLPFVFPVIQALGFHPVWFGVMMTMYIEIGQITPPMGLNLFTLQGVIPTEKIEIIWISALPFVIMLILGVALFTLFPEAVLILVK